MVFSPRTSWVLPKFQKLGNFTRKTQSSSAGLPTRSFVRWQMNSCAYPMIVRQVKTSGENFVSVL